MPEPGDVVTVDFAGSTGTKRRPAIVVSTKEYHACRPDVILALLTTQTMSSTTMMDYVLLDWSGAGLKQPSMYRAFLGTYVGRQVRIIGRLSDRDWAAVQTKLGLALAVQS